MTTPFDLRGDAVQRAERRADSQAERAERWRAKFDILVARKRCDMRLLDRLDELLRDGDLTTALDLLGERREARAAARERREAQRAARQSRS